MLDAVLRSLSHILVPLFLAGMSGATIVVIITFTKDLIDFFQNSEPPATANSNQDPLRSQS